MVDKKMRAGWSPMDALLLINKQRERNNVDPAHKSSVYRYVKGDTHRKGTKETRGRPPALTRKDKLKLEQARRRLLKQSNSEKRVTHADVMEEAGLEGQVCQKVCEQALKANIQGVIDAPATMRRTTDQHPRR